MSVRRVCVRRMGVRRMGVRRMAVRVVAVRVVAVRVVAVISHEGLDRYSCFGVETADDSICNHSSNFIETCPAVAFGFQRFQTAVHVRDVLARTQSPPPIALESDM